MRMIISLLCISIAITISVTQIISQASEEQDPLISFLNNLDTIPDAERKLSAIISFSYSQRYRKSIYPLTLKARQIANGSGDIELIAVGNEYAANYFQYNFNLDSAEWYYKKALADIPMNLKAASIIAAYGGLLSKQGNIPKSIEYSLRAKKIYENNENILTGKDEVKRKGQYGSLLNSIGNIYNKFEDFELANSYYDQAQLQFRAINDTTAASIILSNKGELLNENGRYKEALNDLLEARQLKQKIGLSIKSITMTDFNIADSYKGLKDYKSALSLYQSTIDNFEKLDYDFGKAISYTNLGLLLYDQNDFDAAYKNCKTGNDYALIAESADIQELSFECLYKTLKMLNKPAEALAMHEAFIIKRDSIKNEKNTKLITQMEMNYAYQKEEVKKEGVAKDKARKNTLIISSLTGVIFSLFLISYLIYKSLVERRSSEKILAEKNDVISKALYEKDILLREIHHRVKNNLQVISSLLSLQSRYTDDPQIALAIKSGKDRVKAMTLIHQNLYQKENLTGIQVHHYFDKLIKSLFDSYNISPGKIKLETDIDPMNLDVETAVPLGLIANELITNALKYAFPNDSEGCILVSLKEENNRIIFSVTDNGVGIDEARKEGKDGFGLELVDAFKIKLAADFDIISNEGTSVVLKIKDYKKTVKSQLKQAS